MKGGARGKRRKRKKRRRVREEVELREGRIEERIGNRRVDKEWGVCIVKREIKQQYRLFPSAHRPLTPHNCK